MYIIFVSGVEVYSHSFQIWKWTLFSKKRRSKEEEMSLSCILFVFDMVERDFTKEIDDGCHPQRDIVKVRKILPETKLKIGIVVVPNKG